MIEPLLALPDFRQIPSSTLITVALAVAVNLAYSLGRRFLTDVKKTRRIRTELSEFDRQWRQAMFSRDRAKEEKLKKKKKQMDEMRMKLMSSEMKPTMLFLLPLLGAWYGISAFMGVNTIVAVSPIPLPLIGPSLGIDLAARLSLFWWYMIASIALSGVVNRAMGTSAD